MNHLSSFILTALFLFSLVGCLPIEETPDRSVSFYFEELENQGSINLVINGDEIGLLSELTDPICGDTNLVTIDLSDDRDMHIHLVMDGDSTYLGYINLYSVATGLKIKPVEMGTIFVSHDIDDFCSIVRLKK